GANGRGSGAEGARRRRRAGGGLGSRSGAGGSRVSIDLPAIRLGGSMSAQPVPARPDENDILEFWAEYARWWADLQAAYWAAGGPSAEEAERQQQAANHLLYERRRAGCLRVPVCPDADALKCRLRRLDLSVDSKCEARIECTCECHED